MLVGIVAVYLLNIQAGTESASPSSGGFGAVDVSPKEKVRSPPVTSVPEPDAEASGVSVTPEQVRRPSLTAGPESFASLRTAFEQHYASALEGDPESMYVMSRVMANCVNAAPYQTREEFEQSEFANSGQVPEAFLDAVRHLFPDCGFINSRVPPGTSPDEWRAQWLDKAIASGHPLARLDQYAPTSGGIFRTTQLV